MEYTLGVLDEEEEQIELIETIFENDFNIVRINSISSIDDLLDVIKSEKINVLAIDYKLKDHDSGFSFNGDYFFNELLDKFGDFPAFVLTRDVPSAKNESKKINPRFIVDKSIIHSFINPSNSKEKAKFIDELTLEIQVHLNKIEEDKNELRELEKILESGESLNEKENRYIELNNKISKSISGYNEIPHTYFSNDTNYRLDLLIQRTEELLNKLK